MIILILFAFLAGIVTILSPCILPLLPIILSAGVSPGKASHSRPLGIITGFILSFTFFTLFLSTIVRLLHLPADFLRGLAVIFILVFGISLLLPQIQVLLERLFTRLSAFAPRASASPTYFSGLTLGLSLGLLWTPCVGPILASVISLAIIGTVTLQAILITLAYSIGTAIPMLAIMYGGRSLLQQNTWLLSHTTQIQKAFAVVIILTAVGISQNWDRRLQTKLLQIFPGWGTGLTAIEDQSFIKNLTKTMSSKTTAPEFVPTGEWFNSPPLTLASLRGKVVLLDFWTYTCINCQRTFPYLKTWWQKYQSKGLVIIGAHAPEFEFEKDAANVRQAIADFDLQYPIFQDNAFATWRAYQNRYWPAKYLIDKDGQVRYTHFGEGNYDETEALIQELLQEIGVTDSAPPDNPTYQITARTPETYLGYSRIDRFSSPEAVGRQEPVEYSLPQTLPPHSFAFTGRWGFYPESALPQAGASLELNFEAKSVFLVMNPEVKPAPVEIYLDGLLQKTITVDTDKLYTLIDLLEPGSHRLRLVFPQGKLHLFAFTFG